MTDDLRQSADRLRAYFHAMAAASPPADPTDPTEYRRLVEFFPGGAEQLVKDFHKVGHAYLVEHPVNVAGAVCDAMTKAYPFLTDAPPP